MAENVGAGEVGGINFPVWFPCRQSPTFSLLWFPATQKARASWTEGSNEVTLGRLPPEP